MFLSNLVWSFSVEIFKTHFISGLFQSHFICQMCSALMCQSTRGELVMGHRDPGVSPLPSSRERACLWDTYGPDRESTGPAPGLGPYSLARVLVCSLGRAADLAEAGDQEHLMSSNQIRAGMKSSSICIIPLAVMRMTQEY